MQVATYARVSTTNQKREATIDSQIRRLKEYIEQQGWNLLPTHISNDEGISGARLDRPALDRLRDAAKQGEIDTVAVLSPDRLARHYAHQWLLIEEFQKSDVPVLFLENPFGDTPQGKLLVQMQAMMAEYERAAIAERTRRGKLEKARRGEYMPWAYRCYGYTYLARRAGSPPQVIINENEAAIVRKIFHALVQEQMSLRAIAKRLTQTQVPTPAGKNPVWKCCTLRSILTNRVFTGRARYNYRTPAVCKSRRPPTATSNGLAKELGYRPEAEWIWAEAPAIISEELYEKAQIQLRRNQEEARKNYQPSTGRYLLRRRVRCGRCGLAMRGQRQSAQGRKYEYFYYTCPGLEPLDCARLQKCSASRIPAKPLDDLVWSALTKLLKEPSVIPLLHQEWRAAQQTDREQLSAQQNALLTRRARLEAQVQKLIDAYQHDVITLTELQIRRKKLESDIERLRLEEKQLAQQQQEGIRWQHVVANMEQFTNLIEKSLDDLSFADRQALVQCLIEKVVVTGADVDIHYILPFDEAPRVASPEGNGTREESGRFYRLRLNDR